ncbi:MAG: hypothetical protein IK083_00405 [Abditibacteriota bacterium]|nr:hypothetical protein [Abditibacteriota bacterium]
MNHIYYASDYAALDSHVEKGGGTDDTAALQGILDKARDGRTPVKLIMDGAALITGLTIWSNTTIECVNPSCGFFLKDGSDRALLRNGNADFYCAPEDRDRNITISGGTWNHNARGQRHDVPCPDDEQHIYQLQDKEYMPTKWVLAFELYGVENVTMKDMTIRNQRTFTLLMANFKFVNIDNVNIVLDDYMSANNQDGLHFFGPGQFLNLRNITGTSGDDFIAIAPDERDGKSSITDVMIDGVHLNNADQGIRLLCRGEGELDRVLIKNVTGTFRGYGFIINPWFPGNGGHYRNIVIDTVDLHCRDLAYDYMRGFVFKLGGNIDNLVLRNVHYHSEVPLYLIDAGGHYMRPLPSDGENPTLIDNLVLENVYICGDRQSHDYIRVRDRVNSLVISNVQLQDCHNPSGALIRTGENGSLGSLYIDGFTGEGLGELYPEETAEQAEYIAENDIQVK